MSKNLAFDFSVNKANNTIAVKREFAADLPLVWEAYTNPEILDQWWAPKPWKTQTKSMDFRDGGHWHYAMVGPAGEVHWCFAQYLNIEWHKRYTGLDGFSDENGTVNQEMPQSKWDLSFTEMGEKTMVESLITYPDLAQLEATIQMGFKEGFTMALENLDQYLEAQFKRRNELRTDRKARVCSYLNFPGTTEEAFLFYRSVFKTEFSGNGIQRFGDLPADANHPPVAEALKKMILHIELPITGGHILMGTDAPKEMGFTLTQGNNMHLSLEPESREEAQRLFEGLSAGGTISMPMQDMFWGAYFGSFTDKYGINWMINYTSNHP